MVIQVPSFYKNHICYMLYFVSLRYVTIHGIVFTLSVLLHTFFGYIIHPFKIINDNFC